MSAAAAAADAVPVKSGGKKKLVLMVAVAAIVLGGGGVGAMVYMKKQKAAAEEAAAAAEARGIGGPRLDDAHGDEAFEAVYEAGGGEAEGFEAAEDALIENASHGDGRADPIGDAFTPETESDEATVVDGEADEERVSELGEDDTDRR